MRAMRRLADTLDRVVAGCSWAASWLFFALVAVMVIDVVTRKFNIRVPYLESTRLQELEWHLHGALLMLCLGYGYICNAHVRIDVVSGGVAPRTRAWLELLGCLVFAIPFCLATIYMGTQFFAQSYVQNEMSEAATGLPHRWIIKGLIPLGLLVLLMAVFSTTLRQILVLFGRDSATEQPDRV